MPDTTINNASPTDLNRVPAGRTALMIGGDSTDPTATPVTPLNPLPTVDMGLRVIKMEQVAVTGVATDLPTAPTGARQVMIQPAGCDLRYRLTGLPVAATAPTATSGLVVYEGSKEMLLGIVAKIIATSGSGTAELVWCG